MATNKYFEIIQESGTIVVTSQGDLRELDGEQIEQESQTIVELLDGPDTRNIVIDLRQTDYCGSTALSTFVTLWRHAKDQNGRLIFCNVSPHVLEVMSVTDLDALWPIYPSRDEAMKAV